MIDFKVQNLTMFGIQFYETNDYELKINICQNYINMYFNYQYFPNKISNTDIMYTMYGVCCIIYT